MIGWRERQERIAARGAEYRAGAMTEDQFRAYLFGMRVRGEDIRFEMGSWAPPVPEQTFEECRLIASRQWLKGYLNRG